MGHGWNEFTGVVVDVIKKANILSGDLKKLMRSLAARLSFFFFFYVSDTSNKIDGFTFYLCTNASSIYFHVIRRQRGNIRPLRLWRVQLHRVVNRP